jgi:hypothetical protein
MKTNQFERTIRRKLESISPDFHEDNWARMQQYMQVNNPPGFWQQYGSWVGYAAAASVTAVMAFLYTNQLAHTNELRRDLSEIKKEIRLISAAPSQSVPMVDTVYMVQKEFIYQPRHNRERFTQPTAGSKAKIETIASLTQVNPYTQGIAEDIASDFSTAGDVSREANTIVPQSENQLVYTKSIESEESKTYTSESMSNSLKMPDDSYGQISALNSRTYENTDNRSLKYALADRISLKQTKKVLAAYSPAATKNTLIHDKKVDRTAKADHIIPQLNIKAPYRFGAGFQFEGNNQVKTIVGEVIVAKKFSLATGLSWLRAKPLHFKSEKIFREKNKDDFKKMHPGEVPMAFEVKNINVNPTLLQIPLTLAFRNDVAKDFSYFVGAGTNITVSGREKITYDCLLPLAGKEINDQYLERKMNLPLFNSMNVTAGIEKSWHPIVVQIEGYVYSYFKPLTPMSQRTGPGVKMKLLYQIGKKM